MINTIAIDNLLNPIIEIHHYLNALKIYKTYELMIDKDLPIQQNEFNLFSIKHKRTLKFKLSFKKIYYHISSNPNDFYFWCCSILTNEPPESSIPRCLISSCHDVITT